MLIFVFLILFFTQLTNARSLACGGVDKAFCCFIDYNNDIECFGLNKFNLNVKSKSIAAGDNFICVIDVNNRVVCNGINFNVNYATDIVAINDVVCALSNNITCNKNINIVNYRKYETIITDGKKVCGISNKTLYCPDYIIKDMLFASLANNYICYLDINYVYNCNLNLFINTPNNVVDTISHNYRTCVIDNMGIATCVGGNNLFNENNVPNLRFVTIALSNYITCGIIRNSLNIVCWGYPSINPPMGKVFEIVSGYGITAAITVANTLYITGNAKYDINIKITNNDSVIISNNAIAIKSINSIYYYDYSTKYAYDNIDYINAAILNNKLYVLYSNHTIVLNDKMYYNIYDICATSQHLYMLTSNHIIDEKNNIVFNGTYNKLVCGYLTMCVINNNLNTKCVGNILISAHISELSIGSYHALAIKSDNTLIGFGDNSYGVINVPSGTYKSVAAGHYVSCAIKFDNTAACWGYNLYNQIILPSVTVGALADFNHYGSNNKCLEGTYSNSIGAQNSICSGPCAAGYYGNGKDNKCSGECEIHHYCPLGTSKPILCPDGYYNNEYGMDKCNNVCPAGYYCKNGIINKCPSGSISSIGSSTCNKCIPGTYQSNIYCYECAPGSYSDSYGQTTCKLCSKGKYQNLPKSTSCNKCESNKYSPMEGLALCIVCSTVAIYNNTQCYENICNAGQYSDWNTLKCVDCLIGKYSSGRADHCDDCPPNTYALSNGSSTCNYCYSPIYCHKGIPYTPRGYWLAILNNKADYVSCPTELCLDDSKCADGRLSAYDNPLCAKCNDGLINIGNNCIPCNTHDYDIYIIVIIGFALLIMIVIILYHLAQRSAGLVNILTYYIQITNIITHNIVLNFISSGSNNYIRISCIFDLGTEVYIYLLFISPLILLIVLYILKLINNKCKLSNILLNNSPNNSFNNTPNNSSNSSSDKYKRTVTQILMLSLVPSLNTAIQLFICVDIKSTKLVYAYPTLECDNIGMLRVVACSIIIFYSIYLIYIIYNINNINPYILFLTESYDKAYWAIVIIFKRLTYVIFNAILYAEDNERLFTYCLLSYVGLMLQYKILPHKNKLINIYDNISHILILFVSMLSLYTVDINIAPVIITCNIGIFILYGVLYYKNNKLISSPSNLINDDYVKL